MAGVAAPARTEPELDLAVLDEVQRRVLWLAASIVHHANRVRPNRSGVKVGGHQASSASMVSLMTALWFGVLEAPDRVSVKPHASPVLHAINHLLGRLDRRYLTTLREYGGLQSYPSRTKDPDPVDHSTGSVGPGIAAGRLAAMFEAAGWHTVMVKYGPRLSARPALRARIDAMPNEEYQRLLRADAAELRARIEVPF